MKNTRTDADHLCSTIRPAAEAAVARIIAASPATVDPRAIPLLPRGHIPDLWWQSAPAGKNPGTPRQAAVAAAEQAADWLAALPAQVAAAAAEAAGVAEAAGRPDVAQTVTARGRTAAARAQLASASWQTVLSATRLAVSADPEGTTPAHTALAGADLVGRILPQLAGLTLNGADLTAAALHGSDRLTITGSNMAQADITGTHHRPDWSTIDLADATVHAVITAGRVDASADRMNADGSALSGCTLTIRGAASMRGVRVDGGTLAIDSGAGTTVLAEALLHSARITVNGRVNASGARMDGCTLSGIWTEGSSLARATVTGCLLTADLSALNQQALAGVQFRGCRIGRGAAWPAGFTPPPSDRSW